MAEELHVANDVTPTSGVLTTHSAVARLYNNSLDGKHQLVAT